MDRYIYHYIRNLNETSPLTSDDLKQAVEDFSHFRVSWGGQYFDFSCDQQVFHPIEGKSSLLVGSGVSDPRIIVKPYTIQDFLELIKDANHLIMFCLPESLQFTPLSDTPYCVMKSKQPDMFQSVRVYKYFDYNKLLIYLENKEYISSISSQNLIASIDKRFQISQKAVKLCPHLREYENHFYEADCLGTELHQELTTLLKDLC